MKRLLSVLLSAAILLTGCLMGSIPAGAALSPSGSCGDNAYYTYNSETNLMTISGTGKIRNNAFTNERDQWFSIKINEGITEIGSYAFCGANFRDISIPASVTKLNIHAVANASPRIITILNPKCQFAEGAIENLQNDILWEPCIYGYAGSTAQTYAEQHEINFQAIEGDYNCVQGKHLVVDKLPPSVWLWEDNTCDSIVTKVCALCLQDVQEALYPQGHDYQTVLTKASMSQNGSIVEECTRCGDIKSKRTIYKASNIRLSGYQFTYTGDAIKPTVTIKDAAGKTVSPKNYTVSYKNNVKIGKGMAVITFKRNYSGSTTVRFNIIPPKTSFTAVSSGKTSITWKWKKVSGATGYQIRYWKKGDYNHAKYIKIKGADNLKTTVKKLKKNTEYYYNIRVYKTVKVDGKDKAFWSRWSAAKRIKTKA